MSKMKAAALKPTKKPGPPSTASRDSNAIDASFELELYWCVQQLETALRSGKLNPKVAEDTAKNLKSLTSEKAPVIKKRQVMKSALGDYRAKMKEEEKKMSMSSKQVKFTTANSRSPDSSSSFVKKSSIRTSGKDFRFNFSAPINENTMEGNDVESKNTGSMMLSKDSTTGGVFKFNFVLDEMNENLNFNELSIKS